LNGNSRQLRRYGRALQAPALKAWKGQAGNVAAAQKTFSHRARMNSKVCFGRYKTEMEQYALAA
jgi:fructose-bisphosphate aldolase class I